MRGGRCSCAIYLLFFKKCETRDIEWDVRMELTEAPYSNYGHRICCSLRPPAQASVCLSSNRPVEEFSRSCSRLLPTNFQRPCGRLITCYQYQLKVKIKLFIIVATWHGGPVWGRRDFFPFWTPWHFQQTVLASGTSYLLFAHFFCTQIDFSCFYFFSANIGSKFKRRATL